MSRFNHIPKLARITFNRGIAAFIAIFILLLPGSFLQPAAAQSERPSRVTETDTVYVAPPTGEREIDRANILSAIEQVEAGGTVQFAPGKYVVGKVIQINNPQIKLLGHPDGTILRGCEPDEFAEIEKALATISNPTEGWAVVSGCGMLELTGGNVTVRNFTFEYTRLGLLLGRSHAEDILYPSEGGYLIEENTFRNSSNSIRAMLASPEPTIIRHNRFMNVFHAFSGSVSNFHILDNRISAPEPNKILPAGHPGSAIALSALLSENTVTSSCKQNLIAGNQIEGHPDGIILSARQPGAGCQNNVIRANTIEVQRAKLPASWPYFEHYPISDNDSTLVGIPLSLFKNDKPLTQENTFKNNLIEDNQIAGAEGLGIEILNASQNRIVNNTITGIINRQPFPGNTLGGTQFGSPANGSGIWLSHGSDGNKIVNNTFNEIASNAVFIEGDSNRVELNSDSDSVRDLGKSNQIHEKNNSIDPLYESKFVEARGLRLQYMDFGGEGLPVIFLQDFHDYFYEGYESPSFYASFTVNHRVLAPYARGWGESDNTGWGYDVATQSEDILGFMDALGIRRAVLAGRTGGDHDITWIAEHHPERVAGLIYYDNLRIFPDLRDPIVRSFVEMTWITCHMGEESVARLGPRAAWRPHFLYDESTTINIPAIRFFAPEFHQNSRSLSVLGRVEQRGSEAASRCADQAILEEYDALSKDKERLAALRKAIIKADLAPQANRAIERAFGNYLKTIVMNKEEEYTLEFKIPHIDRFLENVEKIESGTNE